MLTAYIVSINAFLLPSTPKLQFHQHALPPPFNDRHGLHANPTDENQSKDRRRLLLSFLSAPAILVATGVAAIPPQKSYSSNARNMDRLSNGDSSAGSQYDNNPKSAVAAKRRAMQGCKVDDARKKADVSERECNLRVMGGDSEFMLGILRELECVTCPFGIRGA